MNPAKTPLTPQELRLRLFLRILFFFYIGAVLLYLLPGITFIPDFLKPYTFINDPAFANNSTIKMGLFVVLCFMAAADVRKFLIAAEVIIVVMMLAIISGILIFCFAKNNYVLMMGDKPVTIKTTILYSTIFDAVINAGLIFFYVTAQKARYHLSYFSAMQFRALQAVAEVLIQGEKELLKPSEVAYNVDRYMGSFKGKTKFISKLCLTSIEIYPLFFLKPPVSYMRPDARKDFLMRHFYQDVSLRIAPPFLRMLVQAMIRMAKQLSFMGYYNDPRTHASVGYVPFSNRPDKQERINKFPLKPRKPLYVMNEKDVVNDVITADVVIVGSGPGASVLAKGLIEKGRRVLMIERGNHVDPIEFNEDEIDMVSNLYADGALQLAADFSFQVIQGSCVGGSSVVNNAVCFDTPDTVLDRWNDKNGTNAGLDLSRYKQCNQDVNEMIRVRDVHHDPVLTDPRFLNPGGQKFVLGCEKMKLNDPPNKMDAVSANVEGCLGCGYCNIGCQFGKKLSMLDTILPETQEKHGRDALQVIAGCEVWKIKSKGSTATSVIGKFKNGRKIEVKGNTIVVSAGAISSSLLLQRSGIAVGKAGKNLCFNIGSPISAVFPDVINSYDGLQISHFLQVNPSRGYIFETWFNPPMFQSTVMPGWWDDHFKNMQRYNRMACTGVLVGSDSNAEARIAGLTKREIRYTPTPKDFDTLLDGLILAGEIYFAAGAECVMPNTFDYYEYKSADELKAKLKQRVKDNSDITVGTGHPQGGNRMSMYEKQGVVNNEFKVYGYKNLFVCDASVIPSSLGVNPQITVMTLANYAAPIIAGK